MCSGVFRCVQVCPQVCSGYQRITPEDRSRRGATVNNEISILMTKSRDKRKSELTKKRARLEETGDGELLRVADVKNSSPRLLPFAMVGGQGE